MKIYEKIVIDMSSGETISEISYNYEGSLALCGSSGGGGSSGKVDYPSYMKDQHLIWLTAVDADITTARTGDSPFYAATAYDPTTPLAAMNTAICVFNAIVDALNSENNWASAVAQAKTTIDALIDDTYINAEVASFADVVDDQIDNIIVPKFQRGMQDINAVQSSSYVLGEALIYGMRDRDVAKYQSELRIKAVFQRNEMIMKGSSEINQSLLQRVEFEKMVLHYTMEYNRMFIAATKDEEDRNTELDELDARWDLETFQYGANMLAAIGGAATNQGTKNPSQAQSAIGGALSGAGAGAMMTPANPLIGGAIGGVLGLASSFL